MNPADDPVFALYAQVLIEHGETSIVDFERRLRMIYPYAGVHARELSSEPILIWYVYRDGHWVDTRRVAPNAGGHAHDARSTR